MADGGHNHPNTIYREFMAERASFVSIETLRYYREKLEPFILWCEKQSLADITQIDRGSIGDFLAWQGADKRPFVDRRYKGILRIDETLHTMS